MNKTLQIDDKLVEDARKLTGETDDSAAVERILKDALGVRSRNARLLDFAGTVEFYEGYDPKTLRFFRNDPG